MRWRRRQATLPAAVLAALLCALAAAPLPAGAQDAAAVPEVREIAVAGAKMVEEATVRARIASREGAPYDPEQVSRDVRAIYELGSFENVTVDAEGFEGGMRLTYRLTERPLLREVAFSGNDEVKSEDLRERGAFVLNAPYNPVTVAEAVTRLVALYREKGFYQAQLRTDTEALGEGQVRLKVQVEEGEKFKVVEVALRGVASLPESEVRDQMKTSPWTLWSWLSDSGRLRHDLLEEDRQRIASFYQDHGFLDVRVGEPEIAVDDTARTVRVAIPVTEGQQYRLASIALQGDELLSLEELRGLVKLKDGEVFRRSLFVQGIAAINRRYASRGYAFVRVDYATKTDPQAQTIAVTFIIGRGPQARFGRIDIVGNVTTRDRVVRRQLTFAEGEVFNNDKLARSRQKVMNLGLFESVDFVPKPRGEDVIDIEVAVKERLTGQLSFGAGYGSEDKLTGQVQLQETNFLGRGQSLALNVRYSATRRNYTLSFTEPALFDGPWSAGFSVYDALTEYDEYDRKSVGGRLSVGRSLGEFFRGGVSVKHETVTVSNVDDTASTYIREQEGRATTNSLRLSLSRDTRDFYLNPSRGNRTAGAVEYAGGALGGDNSFTKLELEHATYVPLIGKLVGMIHGEYGRIEGFGGHEPPIYEKFFLGGLATLRGFQYRSVGPVDENDDPKGGVQQLYFNAELIYPLVPEQALNLVAFYDTGNAWDKGESVALGDLRESAGFGIRWMSPIGPLRMEWGYVLDRREGESKSDWGIQFGTVF